MSAPHEWRTLRALRERAFKSYLSLSVYGGRYRFFAGVEPRDFQEGRGLFTARGLKTAHACLDAFEAGMDYERKRVTS